MNKLARFTVKILKKYAKEQGINPRNTSDLSPLEKWLILELYSQEDITSFIGSVTNKEFNRIRNSKSDAECRRILKEKIK